jgi:hypothetical protein
MDDATGRRLSYWTVTVNATHNIPNPLIRVMTAVRIKVVR